ncbi:MAG: MoaD/ThiS family protein [Anaerolineales bacterium]|nr:MoaD/ThiS family protein [Anaerolineales bacterium]
MPIVRFPALMKYYVDNQSEFSVDGSTIAEVLDNILVHSNSPRHLVNASGNLRRHFNIFVNGVHLRDLSGMETNLKEGDKVILMASAAGG